MNQLEAKTYPQRTDKQNASLHLMFRHLASELNDSGLTIERTLSNDISIPWNEVTVKELLFKPIMSAQLQKNSTTELTTVELDQVFDTLNRHLGEKFGIHVDFPSIDHILHEIDARRGSTT